MNRFFVACSLLLIGLASCNTSNSDELTYEFFKKNESAPMLDSNSVALMHIRQYVINGKDTLDKQQSYSPMPFILSDADVLSSALKMVHEGDSARFVCMAKQLIDSAQMARIGFPMTSEIHRYIGVIDILTKDEHNARQAKAIEERKQKQEEMRLAAIEAQKKRAIEQDSIIRAYIATNKMQAKRTEKGVYYMVTKPGKGKKPSIGDQIDVHYIGTLLDGKQFDSSIERGASYQFAVGKEEVIPGWDDAFPLLTEGSSATLLVPSDLAYGERGAAPNIPSNAILRFDVQFVKNLTKTR
jgi:FKBP-type peptidyl-prolyl cis-trans isomerase